MKKQFVLLIIICALFTTCAKDSYNADICFQEDVLPIFVSNCAQSGCHNPTDMKAGYDLTNYDGIMQGVKPKYPIFSKVYTTVKGNNPSMPREPYSKLNARDVAYIKVWIDIGAPNSSNCKKCDSINYTYSKRVDPIMQLWCVGCHSTTNSSGGFDMSNYNGVVNAITKNRFLGSLEHLTGYSPMPKNAGSLNQCDLIAIRKWVDSGYPDN